MATSAPILKLDDKDFQFLDSINVARFATIDELDRPPVVPNVQWYNGGDKSKQKLIPAGC